MFIAVGYPGPQGGGARSQKKDLYRRRSFNQPRLAAD